MQIDDAFFSFLIFLNSRKNTFISANFALINKTIMNDFTILILAASIPAILVLCAAYLVLSRTLKTEEKRRDTEVLLASKRLTIPIRLQAYERLILFMERIALDSMVLRLKDQMQTNADLQLSILQNIRSEYEHNLSQQLYVSMEVWDKIKEAKEGVVTFVNDAAKEVNPQEASIGLAKQLFDKLVDQGELPTAAVLRELKGEARRLF